jgi:hypothetical protein
MRERYKVQIIGRGNGASVGVPERTNEEKGRLKWYCSAEPSFKDLTRSQSDLSAALTLGHNWAPPGQTACETLRPSFSTLPCSASL